MIQRVEEETIGKIVSLVSPLAYIAPSAQVMKGSLVEPLAIIQSGSAIMVSCFILSGAIVGHASMCCDGAFVGLNATVSDNTIVPRGKNVERVGVFNREIETK